MSDIRIDMATVDNCYPGIAEILRGLADRMDSLAGLDLPVCNYVAVDIQPATRLDDAVVINAVDTVAGALIDKPGETNELSDGMWMHAAKGSYGPVTVSVYNYVEDPERRSLREENARLHAELDSRRSN